MMDKEHCFEIRVYTEDTDLMGIVYHSKYLSFLERARSEMIRKTGLSLSILATYDCHFAICRAELDYLSPARLDDLLRVRTKIASKKSCSLLFDQTMQNQHNKQICKAQIKVVCIDEQMKPRRLPKKLFD